MSHTFVLAHNIFGNGSLVTFLLMPSVSSNLLSLSVDLILGNKKKSDGDKSGEYGGGGI
jgi:hypothetical protein